jgi:hypothetical protein
MKQKGYLLGHFSSFLPLQGRITQQLLCLNIDQCCHISGSIEDLLERPFALSPAAMSLLFRNLHCVGRGDYGQQYPKLFSRYVPGILPPMVVSDIAAHIVETRELQSNLLAQGGAGAGAMQQGQKRKGDDDNYGPTFCVTLASQQMLPLPPDV